MSKLYCGIDLSLRSTAIVVLDDKYKLINQKIITSTTKEYNNEALLLYNSKEICNFISSITVKEEIEKTIIYHSISHIGIERLSYASTSGKSDLISANNWILRTKLYELYPSIKPLIISVKEWRAKVITDVEQRLINDTYPIKRAKKGMKLTKEEVKENNKNKAIIKKETKALTYNKLPNDIKKRFDKYIISAKLNKDSKYDLADAYFVTKYLIDVSKD